MQNKTAIYLLGLLGMKITLYWQEIDFLPTGQTLHGKAEGSYDRAILSHYPAEFYFTLYPSWNIEFYPIIPAKIEFYPFILKKRWHPNQAVTRTDYTNNIKGTSSFDRHLYTETASDPFKSNIILKQMKKNPVLVMTFLQNKSGLSGLI